MVNNKTLTPLEEIIESLSNDYNATDKATNLSNKSYCDGFCIGISEAIDKLEKIDESVLTPAQVLKASPEGVKAIAMDDKGKWRQYENIDKKPDTFVGDWAYEGRTEVINFNIHYTGDWKDSLFVREDEDEK